MLTPKYCLLCKGETFERKGAIRSNKKILANKILECLSCSFVFLNDDSHISDFHYQQSLMHDHELTLAESRITTIKDDSRRFKKLEKVIKDKNLLEIGCGNGQFLKFAKQSARSIQGVEPEEKNQWIFKREGLNIYTSILDFYQDKKAIDIIVAFHVIEHVKNPIEFLYDLLKILRKNGKIFIETPNSNDALIKLYNSTAFQNFTYWDNHLVLFNFKSFEYMLSKFTGISYKSLPVQRYGIANHLYWLTFGEPGGHVHWDFLESDLIQSEYEKSLYKLKQSDTLFYEITKTNDYNKVNLL